MQQRSSQLFWNLSLLTVILTLGLIIFGAVVRVTDSGLGCGDHWPLCNGRILPPLDNLTAWIEWSHRLFALLIGLLGIGMLVIAFRRYRQHNKRVVTVTVIAAVLYAVQSSLGAIVVVLELPPTMVTLHLGTAMLLLGALLTAAIVSQYQPVGQYARDHVTLLIYITTVLSFVIILTGALVRGSGATLACVDWPLCNGEVFPVNQGQLALVHMLHRFAVVALGFTMLLLIWFIRKDRSDQRILLLAVVAFGLYLLQAGIGALFVLSGAAPLWGAAHVGVAGATWAVLVALSVIETMNYRYLIEGNAEWTPRSQATPN